MTLCCGSNPLISMFADEAGETTGPYFVSGLFATERPAAWREKIEREMGGYPYSLHFHKIGRRIDQRFRAYERVLDLLESSTDWYAHYLRINRGLVDTGYFGDHDQIEFNYWMGMLIQKRTTRSGRCYGVTLADRDRNHADGYLPDGLQAQLATRRLFGEGPHVQLTTDLARHDRLLQVADLIASAVRQHSVPSGNPLKEQIAARVMGWVRPLRGTAFPHQRLYAWDWVPYQRTPRTP